MNHLLQLLADGRFHTGEELGAVLGVSRSAVWKYLQRLEAETGVELLMAYRGYPRKPTSGPPRFSRWLLELFLSPDHDSLIGDLEEEYLDNLNSRSELKARLIYTIQTFKLLPTLIYHSFTWSLVMLRTGFIICLLGLIGQNSVLKHILELQKQWQINGVNYKIMTNTTRHPDYINIKHKLDSCESLKSLRSHNELVLRFYRKNKSGQDEKELLAHYLDLEEDKK